MNALLGEVQQFSGFPVNTALKLSTILSQFRNSRNGYSDEILHQQHFGLTNMPWRFEIRLANGWVYNLVTLSGQFRDFGAIANVEDSSRAKIRSDKRGC
jgi:hypothetical protein